MDDTKLRIEGEIWGAEAEEGEGMLVMHQRGAMTIHNEAEKPEGGVHAYTLIDMVRISLCHSCGFCA